MNNVSVVDNFIPAVPSGAVSPAGVKAVTLAAGMQEDELYAYLAAKGTMTVLGSANSVGAAGGYTQDKAVANTAL